MADLKFTKSFNVKRLVFNKWILSIFSSLIADLKFTKAFNFRRLVWILSIFSFLKADLKFTKAFHVRRLVFTIWILSIFSFYLIADLKFTKALKGCIQNYPFYLRPPPLSWTPTPPESSRMFSYDSLILTPTLPLSTLFLNLTLKALGRSEAGTQELGPTEGKG